MTSDEKEELRKTLGALKGVLLGIDIELFQHAWEQAMFVLRSLRFLSEYRRHPASLTYAVEALEKGRLPIAIQWIEKEMGDP